MGLLRRAASYNFAPCAAGGGAPAVAAAGWRAPFDGSCVWQLRTSRLGCCCCCCCCCCFCFCCCCRCCLVLRVKARIPEVDEFIKFRYIYSCGEIANNGGEKKQIWKLCMWREKK